MGAEGGCFESVQAEGLRWSIEAFAACLRGPDPLEAAQT